MKPFYLETEFIEKWANVCAVQDARGHRQLERESGLGLGERWWREGGLGLGGEVVDREGPGFRGEVVHNSVSTTKKKRRPAGFQSVGQLRTVRERSPRCLCRGTLPCTCLLQ